MAKAEINFRHLMNFIAYIAVVCIGIVLILSKVLNGQIVSALSIIAQSLAYLVTSFSAFFYARSKRNLVFLIVWIVAVVLIVVSYIL